jgi:hypothetical protein
LYDCPAATVARRDTEPYPSLITLTAMSPATIGLFAVLLNVNLPKLSVLVP